jgi:hypothetical protein
MDLNPIIHDPDITRIDQDDNLTVDLLAIAVKAGAPITPQSIGHISLLVQRAFRELFPDAECRERVPSKNDPWRNHLSITGAHSQDYHPE